MHPMSTSFFESIMKSPISAKQNAFGFLLLTFLSLVSCQEKDPGPSLNGTFSGPISVENRNGLTTHSQTDVTLRPLNPRSVEVSGRHFETFTVGDLTQTGSMYLNQDGASGNLFRYSAQSRSPSLLIDWTTSVNGQSQRIRFGSGN